jgi:cytosine/uracil/thiamine/allantoin permease
MNKVAVAKLTIGGGMVFWAVTLASSLLPVAGQFRNALSIPHILVLVASLPAGLFIALCVSYCLVRYYDKVPTKSAIQKSVILSIVVLVIIEAGITLTRLSDTLYYIAVGAALDVVRFLFLGVSVGYLYMRLYGSETG